MHDTASRVTVHAQAVDGSIIKLAFVCFTRGPHHLALALHNVCYPLTFVAARSREGHATLAMALPILPITFIEGTVGPFVRTAACHFVHDEVSLVDVSLRHLIVAFSMTVTILPLALIATTIGVKHFA